MLLAILVDFSYEVVGKLSMAIVLTSIGRLGHCPGGEVVRVGAIMGRKADFERTILVVSDSYAKEEILFNGLALALVVAMARQRTLMPMIAFSSLFFFMR